MKYTAASVKKLKGIDITNFVRKYNATVTRLSRKNYQAELWETLPKISYQSIYFDTYTYKDEAGKEKTKRVEVSSREVARRLNQYAQIFEKENQKVVKFGNVYTLGYIKKVAQQEQRRDTERVRRSKNRKINREEAGTTRTEEKPLNPIKPTSNRGLRKSIDIRKKRNNKARSAVLSEHYKANYLQAVRGQIPAYFELFVKMLDGVSGARMSELFEQNDELGIDWVYSPFEAFALAQRVLTAWAYVLGKENPLESE